MNIFIVPDIFGQTPALERLARRLSDRLPTQSLKGKNRLKILAPYGDGIYFTREDQAYEYFMEHFGIESYSNFIGDQLARETTPVILIGFSAGASALWHLLGQSIGFQVSKAIGFYGSQIRKYENLHPNFDIHLIFPESEPHFDVNALVQKLAPLPRVSCEKAPGKHGFMNEYSHQFNSDISKAYIHDILPGLILNKN